MSWWRREPPTPPVQICQQPDPPDPDQAWKALALVNEWVKHAEAKVGATLAFTGVAGVMLYNLIGDQRKPSHVLRFSAVASAASLFIAGVCGAVALLPRLRLKRGWRGEDPTSLLFFQHVAKKYKLDPRAYADVLSALTSDPRSLTGQIAHQIHANAIVAHRKYRWANFSVVALIIGLVALAIAATDISITDR